MQLLELCAGSSGSEPSLLKEVEQAHRGRRKPSLVGRAKAELHWAQTSLAQGQSYVLAENENCRRGRCNFTLDWEACFTVLASWARWAQRRPVALRLKEEYVAGLRENWEMTTGNKKNCVKSSLLFIQSSGQWQRNCSVVYPGSKDKLYTFHL